MNAVPEPASEELTFDQIGLPKFLLAQLREIGYEAPSPIQARTIPLLLEGRDLIGQAQTGTGKTAAFALPGLSKLDPAGSNPQILVLTPTRELSIQVAEAFQTYAGKMKRFSVLPIYGGQDYRTQTNALKRGVQVIVSTPGRLMDHMRRGNLSLEHLSLLVLDEADEMLRMGFIDDVQWILEQTPQERQIALFSATMPAPIKRIAGQHLDNPVTVEIKSKGNAASTIHQRYWPVQGLHKLEALTRILEHEEADGVIVFVRTKVATSELADKLSARGMRASALNGEMPQKQREQTVDRLRKGRLDILVATDVAARGLDVDRISHVINYDIPYDTESYVHRIGRTGRAGRSGEAVLFVAPRERRMLSLIERAIGNKIEQMKLPSMKDINEQRAQRLTKRISETLAEADLTTHKAIIDQYLGENEVRGADIAAALMFMLQADSKKPAKEEAFSDSARQDSGTRGGREGRQGRGRDSDRGERSSRSEGGRNDSARGEKRAPARMPELEPEMERYRLEVGDAHGAAPGNIVGAIANEAGIDSQYMGRISIHDEFSLIDLPEGMPKAIFKDLKQTRVCGRPLRISRVDVKGGSETGEADGGAAKEKSKSRSKDKAASAATPAARKPRDAVKDKPRAGSRERSAEKRTAEKRNTEKTRASSKPKARVRDLDKSKARTESAEGGVKAKKETVRDKPKVRKRDLKNKGKPDLAAKAARKERKAKQSGDATEASGTSTKQSASETGGKGHGSVSIVHDGPTKRKTSTKKTALKKKGAGKVAAKPAKKVKRKTKTAKPA